MKYSIILSALLVAGCNNAGSVQSSKMLTYDELVNFDTKCELVDKQQSMLKSILERKHFDTDPDKLNDNDRAYNSRLKSTIWWYEYRCEKKQQTNPTVSDSDLEFFKSKIKPSQVKSEITKQGDCQSRQSIALAKDEVVSSNTLTVCGRKADMELEPKVKIGETVFEDDLQTVPEIKPIYFKHRHSKCRLFRERYMFQNVLQVNHGVVCQIDPDMDTWQVIDKW
jgi:hypothetical protein